MINNYKTIKYPYKVGDKYIFIEITDISTNVRIQQDLVNSVSVYNYQTLTDGQTPEMVAYQNYSNVKYHYLVMLANEMYDWRECYPLTQAELDSYVDEKYLNPLGIHHFENAKGMVCYTPEGAFSIPITNYDYEYNLNEAKRFIKVIKAQYTQHVVEMLKQALQQ